MGAQPESAMQLQAPINDLEKTEDPQGVWRCTVNDNLREYFLPLYERVDQWLMLRAPSFDCVFRWRLEQEKKLAAKRSAEASIAVMGESEIAQFIQHYQRLTQRCLEDLPANVQSLFQLDQQRNIVSVRYR